MADLVPLQCRPSRCLPPDRGSRLTILSCIIIAGLWSTTTSAQMAPVTGDDRATVWYLRHSGWAVRVGEALLVFDYQEELGMKDVTADTPRTLDNGLIYPAEISDLDVYVFVSHAHGDHYDPVIFGWQGQIRKLTYFIGWHEEPESHCEQFVRAAARCYTMGGPRATVELDDIQVYTIDSDHNDIPEVAYMVRFGNWVVYHNGDYMSDYIVDHEYLRTISDRIDMAFVVGVPSHRWPHLDRAVHLTREFAVPVLFAMHFPDLEACESFATDMGAEGATAEVKCPAARGEKFVVTKSR